MLQLLFLLKYVTTIELHLSSEHFPLSSANTQNNTRHDIACDGFREIVLKGHSLMSGFLTVVLNHTTTSDLVPLTDATS